MKISYILILFLIILILLTIIIISSIPYSSNEEENNEIIKTKSLSENFKLYDMKNIRPEVKHNCNTINITKMDSNRGYSVVGNFNDSRFSIYKDGERVYSKNINGYNNVIFSSNHNILTPLIKLSKYKNIVIPLENSCNYVIVFDKAENIEIKNYIVYQNILFKEIPINYEISEGFNEYDIHFLTNKTFNSNYDLISKSIDKLNENPEMEKVHLSHFNKYDEWEFRQEGKFIMSIVNNLYNLDILDKNTNELIQVRKNEKYPELIYKEIINPNIVIKNLDFVGDKKDINTEYIELINGPLHLVERFLKGKKSKKINYSMLINNKVMIFKN